MPSVIETTVFQFAELSDSAKEKARDWWRSCRDSSDMDSVTEDFATVAEILGVDVNQRTFRTMGGGTGSEPDVRWGLYTQGSGAAFSGSYRYAKGAVKRISEHTGGTDAELIRIASELQAVQAKHRYGLTAKMSDGPGSNFYPHSGTMAVDVYDRNGEEIGGETEETVKRLMRDLADWLYKQVQAEDEYQTSDEAIDEAMEANEYTFTAEGKRFG